MASRIPRAGLASACALLAGCGEVSIDDRLDDYRSQVARVTGIAAAGERPGAADWLLPPRRQRRLEVEDHRMGGLDFLAIQGCQLSTVIGERNNSLGRVMLPSRLLIHELRVLDSADECLADLSPERSKRLAGILAAKRVELPLHVWNAIWLGEEMEQYLASRPNPLRAAIAQDGDDAMGSVLRVLGASIRSEDDAVALERALGSLGRGAPAGSTIRTLARVRAGMNDVAAMLESLQPTACRGNSLALSRLFESSYLPLQPALARISGRARQQLANLDSLFRLSSRGIAEVPSAVANYHRRHMDPVAPDGALEGTLSAMRRHARAWQPILAVCGRLPGAEER